MANDGMRAEVVRAQKIAELNDEFRAGRSSGRLFVTNGVIGHAGSGLNEVLQAVRTFGTFNEGNDPYGERDFGSLQWNGALLFWKINYYDIDLQGGSPDPSDGDVTTRVLTVLLASEY